MLGNLQDQPGSTSLHLQGIENMGKSCVELDIHHSTDDSCNAPNVDFSIRFGLRCCGIVLSWKKQRQNEIINFLFPGIPWNQQVVEDYFGPIVVLYEIILQRSVLNLTLALWTHDSRVIPVYCSVTEKLSWFIRHLSDGLYIFYSKLWNPPSDSWALSSEMSDMSTDFREHWFTASISWLLMPVFAKYVGQPDISRCSSPVSDGRLKNVCPNVRPNFQTFINNLTDTNIRKYSSTNHERPVYSNKMRIFHKGTLPWQALWRSPFCNHCTSSLRRQ